MLNAKDASQRYSNSAADLENTFMHLTNVAIQKKSDAYGADPFGGKWDLRHLKVCGCIRAHKCFYVCLFACACVGGWGWGESVY